MTCSGNKSNISQYPFTLNGDGSKNVIYNSEFLFESF